MMRCVVVWKERGMNHAEHMAEVVVQAGADLLMIIGRQFHVPNPD